MSGESGLGKSTLINSLFLSDLYADRKVPDAKGNSTSSGTNGHGSISAPNKFGRLGARNPEDLNSGGIPVIFRSPNPPSSTF